MKEPEILMDESECCDSELTPDQLRSLLHISPQLKDFYLIRKDEDG